jgi:hypothetical protein
MAKIENKHTWGVKTAARLRAVYASFPDHSPEDRSRYLVDEIEYALEDASGLPGETRHSLLEVLDEYFPVYGDAQPVPPAPTATVPTREDNAAVDSLVDELCARAAELTPAQRQRLAGVVADCPPPNPGNTLPKQITEKLAFPVTAAEVDDFLKSVNQLWVELGVPNGTDTPLRLNRLLKMLGILSGSFRKLYSVLWPFWGQMAPRELRARVAAAYPNGLEPAILGFVTGGEIGGAAFHAEVEKATLIVLSILVGIHNGAREYGKGFNRKFYPDEIAVTVALEEDTDVSRVRDLVRKCWEKYTQLTKHQTADAISDDILRAVAVAACHSYNLTRPAAD